MRTVLMRKRDRTIVMEMVIVLMSCVMYGQGDYRDLGESKVTVHMKDSGLGTVFRYLMLLFPAVPTGLHQWCSFVPTDESVGY